MAKEKGKKLPEESVDLTSYGGSKYRLLYDRSDEKKTSNRRETIITVIALAAVFALLAFFIVRYYLNSVENAYIEKEHGDTLAAERISYIID